jgi:hypothetical protein
VTGRPAGRPRDATFAADGWSLVDVDRAYRRRDGVYWVPPPEARRALRPGMLARLLFAWADAAPDDPGRERLWIAVDRVDEDGAFEGRLVDEPAAIAPVSAGDPVRAGPEHVLDLATGPGGEPLAARSGLVRCEGHGWSEPCFVCAHLTQGEGLGFHAGGPARLRPDAWCDACDARLRAPGSLDAAEEPRVLAICGGCYDRLRDLHRRDRG